MKPTRKQETGMAIAVVVVILSLLFLCSCSSKKSVTEYVYSHDTIVTYRTDTIRDVIYQVKTDTMKLQEVHTYTVNAAGDTVRENHHLIEHNKIMIIDSTFRYQSERDSLRQALHEAQSNDKVIVKEKKVMPWWGWIIVGCSLIPIILFISRLIINSLIK